MKNFLPLLVLLPALSVGFAADNTKTPQQAKDCIECIVKDELLLSQKDAVEKLSAEEIKAIIDKALEEQNALLSKKQTEAEKNLEAEQLASLITEYENLLIARLEEAKAKIAKIKKVKIESCLDLDIKEETKEAQELVTKIQNYCQNSPQGFFAQITPSGDIKFTFNSGTSNGVKSLTIGGASNLTLAYKGHEVKLTGNVSKAQVGSDANETSATMYNGAADYSLNLGITNFESFAKWNSSYEATQALNAGAISEQKIRRNAIDLGLRYVVFDDDTLKMKFGGGLGVNLLNQSGTTIESINRVSPIITASYDFSVKPHEMIEAYLNARLQQDLTSKAPKTIVGAKAGFNLKVGPVQTGLEYGVDSDSARTGNAVNHNFMFNIGGSLNPNDWRNQDKVKEEKQKREKDEETWKRAQALRETASKK